MADARQDLFVVIAGNVVDGLSHYGPFMDANDAGDWANINLDDEWVCAKLVQIEGATA